MAETKPSEDLSQCVREEKEQENRKSLDPVPLMEDCQDLLTTVMAEFDGTLKPELCDLKNCLIIEENTDDLEDARSLDRGPLLESAQESSTCKSNTNCEMQQSDLSDTFCDEIFLELEKTSTFPNFSDWTLRGNELSGNVPSKNAPR